jgi:hypothetical protein
VAGNAALKASGSPENDLSQNETSMLPNIPTPWLPKLLFRLTVVLALALFLVVFIAPWVAPGPPSSDRWSLVLAAFARDVVVRRTAVGAGVGLLVTAFVFFRLPSSPRHNSGISGPPRKIAGA